MDLSEFPHLTILESRADAWSVRAPDHHWVGANWSCLLVLGDGRMAWARFLTVDRPLSRAIVRPDDPAHLSWLRPGDSCTFFDGYYGMRVELVLGSPRRWFQVRYLPASPSPDGAPQVGTWSPIDAGSGAAGQVAAGASDHEHCSICWGKIGYCGDELGYASAHGEWICLACHREWILPRSIGFALEWIGGAENPPPRAVE